MERETDGSLAGDYHDDDQSMIKLMNEIWINKNKKNLPDTNQKERRSRFIKMINRTFLQKI